MKSGKFTAAQNKETASEFIDSIGELVLICEKEGFIPRYYTPGPQDAVDRTLQDLKQYTHSLVMEELNLGSMIESSLKQIMIDKENEAQIDTNTEEDNSVISDDNMFDYHFQDGALTDSDMMAFKEQFVASADVEDDE